LSAQAVFIVDKIENTLIFLEHLEENIKINQKELSNILGKIVNNSKDLKFNSFSEFKLKEKYYLYGAFDKFLIILQHLKDKPPPEELIIELHNTFIKIFENILENYTTNDLYKFRSFTKVIREIFAKHLKDKKGLDTIIGNSPIIDPIQRDFYPERPPIPDLLMCSYIDA